MKKKIISLFCLMICALILLSYNKSTINSVVASEPDVCVELSTDVAKVYEGNQITATLSLTNNVGIAGLTVRIKYDTDVLSLISATAVEGTLSGPVVFPDPEMLEDSTANLDDIANGTVGYAFAEIKNKTAIGNLLNIVFKVKEGAVIGNTTLSYSLLDASNAAGTSLSIEGKEASIEVECKHSDVSVNVTKEAKCTETGTKTTSCNKCGATVKNETIDAIGHVFGEYVIVKESTCEETGLKSAKCNRKDCSATDTKEIDVLGHEYGDYIVTSPATCTEKGIETATCIRECGKVTTREIEAIGHKFGEVTVTKEPTCTKEGEKEAICEICTERVVESIVAKGHTYESYEIVKEATDKENGEMKRICVDCSDEVVTTIPKLDKKNFELKANDNILMNKYEVGTKINFIASVYYMNEEEAKVGDIRYVPTLYKVNKIETKWEKEPFLGELTFDNAGTYKVSVVYTREIKEKSGWVSDGKTYIYDTDIEAEKKVIVENKDESTDNSNKNETSNKDNGVKNDIVDKDNSVKNETPKTGDITDNMLVILGFVMLVSIIALRYTRKITE